MLCPCCTLLPYEQCCAPYHLGKNAPDALALMRSRYSAYALGLVDYILCTTHPSSRHKAGNRRQLQEFCETSQFEGLTIHEFIEEGKTAIVVFTAHLKQNGKEAGFTEASRFKKVEGRWFYLYPTQQSGSAA